MIAKSLLVLAFVGTALAQNAGTAKSEYHLPVDITECQSKGSCSNRQVSVVLDANWRWTHNNDGYANCYSGTSWDSTYCPDPKTCAKNCAVEGVPQSDWTNPYGVLSTDGGVQLNLVTQGQSGKNIGSRLYLLNSEDQYYQFKLKNKEFTFDVDVSKLPCGVNGALYFVEMESDGGQSKYSGNKAGAKYGTGYCDAQCPHDVKWVYGEANGKQWSNYGHCCAEIDIWEANQYSTAFTMHPCAHTGAKRCTGTDCGDDSQRYNGLCDKDGFDINTYRNGNKNFYGPGSSYTIDSTKPLSVVTQFITADGTDSGDLKEIKRFWVQNGKVIETPKTNVQGLGQYNSMTDANAQSQKSVFKETNDFASKGGMKSIGAAIERGVSLVLSVWDDPSSHMLWLDSDFPLSSDRNNPGVQRGPCSTSSGNPEDVEKSTDTSVKFTNIKIGVIGSTYSTTAEVYNSKSYSHHHHHHHQDE